MRTELLQIAKKLVKPRQEAKPNYDICMTIRLVDILEKEHPEEYIKWKLDNIKYDFTDVCLMTDDYGFDRIMFYCDRGTR